jgi:acetyl esterase
MTTERCCFVPLDPHVQNLLAFLAAAGRPKVWQVTPAEARLGMRALAQATDVKDVPIGRVENGTLPGPADALAYRLYVPVKPASEPASGLVYFHGGGFVIGDLDTHEGFCRMLANASGCRLVSVEYRLAPEHKFPAAVEDAHAATVWIAEHAQKFGIDPQRVAIGGDSAGATLATVVCQLAKHSGRPRLALQLLFCPGTDRTADTASLRALAEGYLLERKSLDWFLEQYVPPDVDLHDPRVSPALAKDVSGLPPAHIHTAEFDPLRDGGKIYADRLAAAGVEVHYTCHPGMIHHFYAMAGAIPYARIAVEAAGAAIRKTLAPDVLIGVIAAEHAAP